MVCLSLDPCQQREENKREREEEGRVSLVVTITTLFDYGNYESCAAKEEREEREKRRGGNGSSLLPHVHRRFMMMMMMMMLGEKKRATRSVLLGGSMKRRDRDATLYPRGWRETEERIQESWLRNCGWEGNARCDDHLCGREACISFERLWVGDKFHPDGIE